MGGGGGLGGAVKNFVGGAAQVATGGLYNPKNGSIGIKNSIGSLGGLGGYSTMLGGDGTKLIGGGGAENKDAAMANAMIDQARASVQAADIAAGAARYQADQTLAGMRLQTDASVRSSQNAAIGGIIGSALGANTTHEEIKQWLPHEAGAATIASWDLAQKWNKTLEMRTAGYNDTAINYELSGKKGSTLFNDAQWNALKMAEMTKRDMLTSVQTFGIKSPSNPTGISISPSEWEELHAMKDPKSMLEVDPAVSAARNAEFSAWEKKMRAEGKGIIVDIYKNPQLAGSNILSMKGKDPMLDPSLAGLIGTMVKPTPEQINKMGIEDKQKAYGNDRASVEKGIADGLLRRNPETGVVENVPGKTWKPTPNTDWDAAIRALTQGEKNPMTDQIKWAMENGIVDKYGMVSAGALQTFIPPSLMEAPEFNPLRPLTDQQKVQLQDQYKQMTEIKVDPKLIREESLGQGITRKVKLNPDGTIAATAMEGYMTDMMGNTHMVSMQGQRMQEWYDRQSMINGKGPLFPGMAAPVGMSELSGRFEDGFWGKNVMAKQNNGTKGTTGQNSNTAPVKSNMSSVPVSAPKAPTNNPAAAVGGAPLAAGE